MTSKNLIRTGLKVMQLIFYSVSLHAVSRDQEAYPSPCIYAPRFEIDTGGADEESDSSDSESNDVLDLSKILMDILFGVFCECAELNPDPIESEGLILLLQIGNQMLSLCYAYIHNWVFSADQVVTDGAEVDDSEWNGVVAPTSSIGYSNGDNDLARTALQRLRRSLELQILISHFQSIEAKYVSNLSNYFQALQLLTVNANILCIMAHQSLRF
ncbi:hypothetical protein DCAR_0729994 [Daucus carota subsp. sativus]|uniref:Uncharacterized protein n=1 Tax=Daucus carota subsp. sativus TaxID=79200 RepID=A0AAF0XMI2_DAUCS|nr:hypothetical protein DCAR_0729994 [Daucus carota subsp. sativus]